MEIYTFDKSLQERLMELTEILSRRGEIVPASEIQTEWSYHIELVIEPIGWKALWKIPRLVCQDFDIHYPTIVVVLVEQVDFAELTALVKIVAVQDEIHLPAKYNVPLIELYPTLNQGNDALDMIGTASCIDQLRFYYNYLWMPWDIDDDDSADWVTLHLETRIRLFFDMKRGNVSKETCDIIRTLMREGREIKEKILRLEDSISETEEVHEEMVDEGKAYELMKLHFRLQQIKTEMEVLENPAIRDMLGRSKNLSSANGEIRSRENKDKKREGYLVWLGGLLEEMKETLSKVQVFLPQDIFLKVSSSLQEALHASDVGDIIVIGEGTHQIRSAGGLEEGGVIKGIDNIQRTILSPKQTESAPSLLDFSGNEVLLENVTIDVNELQTGIIVRKGITKVVNCRICVLNQNMVKLGIVVLPGARLIIENTAFEGLGTAIVIYPKGEVMMSGCNFINCAEGIQLHDNAAFTAKQCLLGHFKEYAIRMETQKYLHGFDSKCGSSQLLEGISEVALQECKFEGNAKGDVALKPRGTLALTTKQDCVMES
ncbi:hypothetical protein KM043_009118 [Ampulex compressa]|nr:hypothetical protein KM043_009118 [Ampulex compressa]